MKETFGPQAKADMLKMVADVENALERDINTLDWMTEATKQQALAKLHAIAEQDRLSGPVARLQRARQSSAATRSATHTAPTRSSSTAS